MFTPNGRTDVERNSMSFTVPTYEILKHLLSKKYKELLLLLQVEDRYSYRYIDTDIDIDMDIGIDIKVLVSQFIRSKPNN